MLFCLPSFALFPSFRRSLIFLPLKVVCDNDNSISYSRYNNNVVSLLLQKDNGMEGEDEFYRMELNSYFLVTFVLEHHTLRSSICPVRNTILS